MYSEDGTRKPAETVVIFRSGVSGASMHYMSLTPLRDKFRKLNAFARYLISIQADSADVDKWLSVRGAALSKAPKTVRANNGIPAGFRLALHSCQTQARNHTISL